MMNLKISYKKASTDVLTRPKNLERLSFHEMVSAALSVPIKILPTTFLKLEGVN